MKEGNHLTAIMISFEIVSFWNIYSSKLLQFYHIIIILNYFSFFKFDYHGRFHFF
jgi:hypothetical protein